MSLVIKQFESDLNILKRMKKSLIEKFNKNSSNDIDKAVELANYLVALGRNEEAQELLQSFVVEIEHQEGREDLWGSYEQGRILLAYLYRKSELYDDEKKCLEAFLTSDMVGDPKYVYQRYLEDSEDHESNMDYAMTETQKYKCSVIGQEALTFLYYYEVLFYFKKEAPQALEEKLEKLIADIYRILEESLSQQPKRT